MAKENEFGYQATVKELENLLTHQFDGLESSKSTARTLLSSGSLIAALLGVLQVVNVQVVEQYLLIFNMLITVAMFGYALFVALCVYVISPINISIPSRADWSSLYEHLIADKSDIDVYKQLISGLIQSWNHNRPLIQKRHNIARYAGVLLPVVVLILLSLSLFPRS